MKSVLCTLKKVHISNFKSFKDITVSLDKFNVIVGPNSSGKTNFIEFFKFLKRALAEKHRPYMPHIEWWTYRNIVWQGDEKLPLEAEMWWEIDGHNVHYMVSFGSIGGAMRILHEKMHIDNIVTLEKEGNLLKISHSKKFIEENRNAVQKSLKDLARIFDVDKKTQENLFTPEDFFEQINNVKSSLSSLLNLEIMSLPFMREGQLELEHVYTLPRDMKDKIERNTDFFSSLIILPKNKSRRVTQTRLNPLSVGLILMELNNALNKFTILRHPNIQGMKSPSSPKETDFLLEDGTNLNNILSNWLLEKQKLPDRIEVAVKELFPNTQVGVSTTPQGEVFIKVYEKGIELNPPCIADGFYKILLVLAAIELKPSLLAIDEIENSLYAEALKYIIDELNASETTVIITTHSPVVVDMVKLEALMIAEKTIDGTTLIKIKEPENVRKKLAELKVTQSDSWLYGDLTNGHTTDGSI